LAIYHLSIKIISRGSGGSAVAKAAYRAGEKITNEYDGLTHDYTKKGGVVFKELLLPENVPAEYADRAVLWNAVEKIEKAKNSQLAREIEIALPKELSYMQNVNLIREYVRKTFVEQGMCADVCIHDKNDGNPHAHVMLTMRPFNEDKTWGDKQKKEYILDKNGEKIYDKKKRSYKCKSVSTTDWNEQTKAEEWREAWADITNKYLESINHAERIDHRSYERQGIEQIPTVHLGVAAHQMEKRGIRTERGDINRQIEVSNQNLRQLKARIVKLQNWVKEETANTEPPTLADYIQEILSRKAQAGKSERSQSIYNLKDAANMLNFLTRHKIMDMAGLDKVFGDMFGRQQNIREELKPIDRRLKTLDEHIRQAGVYQEHSKIHKIYKGLKPKDQADFYESNRAPLSLYEAAERYLKGVMNGREKIPLSTWKSECVKLTAERKQLDNRYYTLKEEIKEAEQIRKSVYSIIRQEERETGRTRKHDIVL